MNCCIGHKDGGKINGKGEHGNLNRFDGGGGEGGEEIETNLEGGPEESFVLALDFVLVFAHAFALALGPQ